MYMVEYVRDEPLQRNAAVVVCIYTRPGCQYNLTIRTKDLDQHARLADMIEPMRGQCRNMLKLRRPTRSSLHLHLLAYMHAQVCCER
jgi:hypothetical protein